MCDLLTAFGLRPKRGDANKFTLPNSTLLGRVDKWVPSPFPSARTRSAVQLNGPVQLKLRLAQRRAAPSSLFSTHCHLNDSQHVEAISPVPVLSFHLTSFFYEKRKPSMAAASVESQHPPTTTTSVVCVSSTLIPLCPPPTSPISSFSFKKRPNNSETGF